MTKSNTIEMRYIREAIQALTMIKEKPTIDNVAKYIGVTKMTLTKFIYENQDLIEMREVKLKNKILVLIKNAYDSLIDKPYTQEWLTIKKEEYKNAIRLDKVTNYGCLDFYNITVQSADKEFINNENKVIDIVNRLRLEGPKWVHYVGGFGDSAPETIYGYRVEITRVNEIEKLGYIVIIQ